MDQKFDLTLFYQVKAKFPAEPGTAIFISATSENIDELTGQIFTAEQGYEFNDIISEHCEEAKPYFVVDNIEKDNHVLAYLCRDFHREEEYITGKILIFRLSPFKNIRKIDMEKVREELVKLGELLRRNSEAS